MTTKDHSGEFWACHECLRRQHEIELLRAHLQGARAELMVLAAELEQKDVHPVPVALTRFIGWPIERLRIPESTL